MAKITARKCTHQEYGSGLATQWTRDANGRIIFFVRWDDTKNHGVAGGWYLAKALIWVKR